MWFIFLNFLILQADLLELPALTKKVKTEADEDYFSSTENLLEVCTELHSYNNDILDKYNCAKLPQWYNMLSVFILLTWIYLNMYFYRIYFQHILISDNDI